MTALRQFYRLLRKFQSQAFHLAAAKECARAPKALDAIVAESFRHFSRYDNRNEHFHPRKTSSLTPARSVSEVAANNLVQALAVAPGTVVGHPELSFGFVDYEISPVRTTGSAFETGAAGRSSRGGIDLLLKNSLDGFPIVGEIKAATDKNPFFALIQGLMYAVELVTESQRSRLTSSYTGHFSCTATGPWIDIYLILIDYPSDNMSRLFLDLTSAISSELLNLPLFTPGIVRRLVALANTTNLTELTPVFIYPTAA